MAAEFNISREEQDAFAAESFRRAEEAQQRGYFAREIVPFTVLQKDANSDKRVPVVVKEDDGIRYGTTEQALAKIRPAFPQWGNSTTTGGNASQITDGAAAVLVMSRREAEKRGLPILAKHITTAVAGKSPIPYNHLHLTLRTFTGVPPRIMGVGPVYAIPMALKNAGLQLSDVDLFEVSKLIIAFTDKLIANNV